VADAPVRLLLAGAGAIGRAHARHVAASDACVLAGVVDPAPVSRDWARQLGVPHADQLEPALAAWRPDGVILATPNTLHVVGALACLERGVPVLVEKPIADRLHDALTLVEAAQRLRVPVLVGHHRRHSAAMATACETIASGVLGRLVAVQGSALFRKPQAYFDAAPWRRESGGGPILINMIHEVDNLRLLAGEIAEVQAIASNARRGHAVEDTVAIVLRFVGGALGTFLLSDAAASTHSWEQTSGENGMYARDASEACYHVSGERGSLAIPTMRLQLATGDEASWLEPLHEQRLVVPTVDPLRRQLDHFIAVIQRREAPRVSAADAAATLAATLAIAESAASGRPVRCDKIAL